MTIKKINLTLDELDIIFQTRKSLKSDIEYNTRRLEEEKQEENSDTEYFENKIKEIEKKLFLFDKIMTNYIKF